MGPFQGKTYSLYSDSHANTWMPTAAPGGWEKRMKIHSI